MANKIINDYTIKRYEELEKELENMKDKSGKKYKKLLELKCKFGGYVQIIKQNKLFKGSSQGLLYN